MLLGNLNTYHGFVPTELLPEEKSEIIKDHEILFFNCVVSSDNLTETLTKFFRTIMVTFD